MSETSYTDSPILSRKEEVPTEERNSEEEEKHRISAEVRERYSASVEDLATPLLGGLRDGILPNVDNVSR